MTLALVLACLAAASWTDESPAAAPLPGRRCPPWPAGIRRGLCGIARCGLSAAVARSRPGNTKCVWIFR